ncbi:hypothetical protein TNIN_221781 [Trichonephila inaurata madagascariensis]|uniref:Uncharacterized protein n=1 Tax=Trichonephila inaurata madagascariensis TaxID=2747483 RepID=A0A8X6YAD9_9ARAC|nr:hypothetical protein TNIN_221781 [Trichonephila inaurata madagascariensis]
MHTGTTVNIGSSLPFITRASCSSCKWLRTSFGSFSLRFKTARSSYDARCSTYFPEEMMSEYDATKYGEGKGVGAKKKERKRSVYISPFIYLYRSLMIGFYRCIDMEYCISRDV